MKKSAIAVFMTSVFLLSLIIPLIPLVKASEPDDTYIVVDGVLDSDSYSLYPYSKQSVNVGFSKYGELIGLPAGADPSVQANWVGLEYGSRDPFAPSSVVPMTSWINGWYIDIEYTDPALTGVKRDRHVWAFALFSDGFGFDGDWVYAANPGDNPGYGRQTNGVCVTDPLVVLYDGPREFIAMSMTHIYDKEGTAQWRVVDVAITLRFNKVTKEVTLYKDVKLTIPKLHLWGKMDVQFSNREEFDIGPYPTFDSYAHFYRAAGLTSYGPDWHLAQKLLRANVAYFEGDGVTTEFVIPETNMLAKDFIKVWINGVFMDPSTYTVDWATKTLKFAVAPDKRSDIEVHYKYVFANEVDWNGKYDIAQVISSDGAYVAWSAMWPLVSDWTVDGILRYLDPLVMVNENDCITGEPKQSPLVIGEWDFLMDYNDVPQFRAVEVKGITDRHDAQDSDNTNGNVVDREAKYQLDMVFNPWDLQAATEKSTRRWVEWKLAGAGTSYTTDNKRVVVVPASEWDQYSTFADRVIDMNTGLLLNRHYGQYGLTLNADGTATFSGLLSTHKYKILYSTEDYYAKLAPITEEMTPTVVDATAANIFTLYPSFVDTWTEPTGVSHQLRGTEHSIRIENMSQTTTTTDQEFTWTTPGEIEWDCWPFRVAYGTTTNLESGAYSFAPVTLTNATSGDALKITLSGLEFNWLISAPAGLRDVNFDYFSADIFVTVNVYYNHTAQTYKVTVTDTFGAPLLEETGNPNIYSYSMMGRYEWDVVGRDSNTVDSAGAALVSEAFDSLKGVQIGLAGADLGSSTVYDQMPFVMAKFGSGTTWCDYKDTLLRAALRDDFCTKWPVASSNMIGVGGPLANLFSYYSNDFTDAFFGLPKFAGTGPYADHITGIPCWNRNWKGDWNVYSSFDTTSIGYAVISTTMDLNGTVLFNVWGHFGRDTYYATLWLHGDEARGMMPGLIELQAAPAGVTAIILQINYGNDPAHPTYSIPEVLGTISETSWYYPGSDVSNPYKGGIHDP